MTSTYHTPIEVGQSNHPDTINAPIGQLDAAILALDSSVNTRIDNLGVEAGNANAEVTAARTAINYDDAPASLSATVRYAALDIYNVLAFGAVADGDGAGGGTDNTAAVNAAIAAATGGGIIYFPPGIYLCDSITMADNITLKGAGPGMSIIDNHDVAINWIGGVGGSGSISGLNNIVIEDLGFIGPNVAHDLGGGTDGEGRVIYATNGSNFWINRCIFREYYLGGLRFGNCTQVYVTNCDFQDVNHADVVSANVVNYGVIAFLDTCTEFVIDGNTLQDTLWGSGVTCIACSQGHIVNNVIKFDAASTETMGVWLKNGCTDIVVAGNYIEEAGAEGVIVVAATSTNDNSGIVISNNRIHNCDYGIACNEEAGFISKWITITGNIITADDGAGRATGILGTILQDSIISDNVIADYTAVAADAGNGIVRGIYLLGGTPNSARLTVANNKIYHCLIGIDTNARRVTFTGNSIDGCGRGIEGDNFSNCVFTGNLISNSVTYGLNATGATSGVYTGAIWHSNIMYNNAANYNGTHYATFADLLQGTTIVLPDGSSVGPVLGLRFAGSSGTGLYQASNRLHIVANGTLSIYYTATSVKPQVPSHALAGSASAPAYAFDLDQDMGIYRAGSARLGISVGGAQRVEIDANGLEVLTRGIKIPVVTSAPSSPANGEIAYADGSGWNPGGTGAGFYGYASGAWVKLH